MGKAVSEDVRSTRAGASLLIVASTVLLVVSVWHSVVGGVDLSGRGLAEAMVTSGWWAQLHLVGSFGFALLAAAAFVLTSAPGAFGTTATTRTGLALVFVGSLVGSVGFVVDGQRAFIAPAVLQGQDLALFNALTLLWDDRGLGVLTFVFTGLGGAVLAAAQLGTTVVSPRWATVLAILGALAVAIFFLFAFGLRIFLPRVVGIPGLFAFGWLILAGAFALKRSGSATAEAQVATQ